MGERNACLFLVVEHELYLNVLWQLAETEGWERSPCTWVQAGSTEHRYPAKENREKTTFLAFTTEEEAGIFTQI